MNKDYKETDNYMDDEMLEYFKGKLLKMKEDLLNKGKEIQSSLQRYSNVHEVNDALMSAENREKMLNDIDDALERIRNGSFGYCEEKGVEIGFKRLDIHPTARYCVEAQEEFDKRKRFLDNESNDL
jgi:DnaK suppressor protein